jgi:hypothetical protein
MDRYVGMQNSRAVQGQQARANRLLAGPAGTQSASFDPDTLAEIDRIRRLAELDLAEYRQRVENANREAENRRIPVRREMNIEDIYRQRMPGAIHQEYGDLMQSLGSVIPLTQQAYDEGVQNILADYGVGAQNQQGLASSADPLAAQLQAMAGRTDGFEQDVEGSSAYLQNILNQAGAQSSQSLGAEGAGVMGAINASLPGYGQEADRRTAQETLGSEANSANLMQQLALIQPEFIPFNYGELQTNMEQDIADAILRGQDRAQAQRDREAEQNRRTYSGIEGAQMFALERGQPQLVDDLMHILAMRVPEGQPGAGEPVDALNYIDTQYMPEGVTDVPTPQYGTRNRGTMERIGGVVNFANPFTVGHFENPFRDTQRSNTVVNQAAIDSATRRRQQEVDAARQLMERLYYIAQAQYSNE